MAFSLLHREANPAERAFLTARGQVSSVAAMRAMAIAGDKGSALVELKAVDAAYPAVGDARDRSALAPGDLLAERDGAFGAVVDPALLARLDLKVGDRITSGRATIELRARLVSEPDKIANGIGFGPRLLVSQEALRATGLVQPGSLVRWTYRLVLPPNARATPMWTALVAGRRPAAPRGRLGDPHPRSTPIRASPTTSSASRSS